MKIKVPDGKGFDVVVWQPRAVGAVYCSAYTAAGIRHVLKFVEPPVVAVKAYDLGATHPREFLGEAEKELKIGGVSPGAKAPMLINPHLH